MAWILTDNSFNKKHVQSDEIYSEFVNRTLCKKSKVEINQTFLSLETFLSSTSVVEPCQSEFCYAAGTAGLIHRV